MPRRVLVAPAHLKEIVHAYGPLLQGAGCTIEYPPRRDHIETELQMSAEELLELLPGFAASLAGSEPYTRAVIAKAAPAGLKVIARAGVGYDAIDLQAATDHGVAVCFAPGTNQEAVAEHAFALILSLIRNVRWQDAAIRRGEWPRKVVGFARGTTMGIVGLGRIGKAMATRANAFGFNVLAAEIAPDVGFCEVNRVMLVPFEELLKRSDVVTVHVPKTPLTKNMIRRETLELMKPTAYVINTARGGVVNEADLYEALKAKRIAGAGLDVYEKEPPGANPLFALDNIILTAHTAGVDRKSREDMARLPAQAIVKLLAGEWPGEWVVNPAVKEKFLGR